MEAGSGESRIGARGEETRREERVERKKGKKEGISTNGRNETVREVAGNDE